MKMHKKITYMSLQRDSILKLYREQEAELIHFAWQSSPVDRHSSRNLRDNKTKRFLPPFLKLFSNYTSDSLAKIRNILI